MSDKKPYARNEITDWMEEVRPYLEEMYKTLSLQEIGDLIGIKPVTLWKHFNLSGITTKRGTKKYTAWNAGKRAYAGIGKDHFNYKGGKNISAKGYVRVLIDGTASYELEHRRVMSQHLGRKLETAEDVHHLDGNKTNNNPSNLVIMTRSEHLKVHWQKRLKNERGQVL